MEDFIKTICLGAFFLSGCAGSGGTVNTPSSVVVPPTQPTTPTTPVAPVDERVRFETFTRKDNLPSGETTITYKVGDYKPTDSFPKTDKYKIADYGFLEVSIKGLNGGCPRSECREEYAAPGPWNHRPASILESDINGDGHKDFYLLEWIHGTRDQSPNELVHAFINDGKGHFKLSNNTVFAGGTACIQQGGEGPQSLAAKDRKSDCGYTTGPLRHALIADFNNDGMDDLFGSMVLHLSDKGVLHHKTLSSVPDYFRSDYIGPVFTHDQYAGDATGDKNIDIFMPTWHNAEKGYWGDGTKISGCSECVATLPWSLLVNDGKGKFTLNQNFPILGVGKDHPLLNGYMPHNGDPSKGVLWGGKEEMLRATTAAIGDFDKDGFGDVAIGWMNPRATETWGLGKNSAGAVYYNDGKNDWRNRPIVPLPANWYGANGNANDMEVVDFDGDGWLDIVLASTKQQPYYEGRVVQFFKNNKNGTFTDVTLQVHPGVSKYENGTGTPLWNGEGQLKLIDFDHDGDLDIVDTVHYTYVLINDGKGKYSIYDHTKFPKVGGERLLFPVEIDGKYQYDFISYTTNCSSDQCTTSYYQVLDPPTINELMLGDLFSKPAAYGNLASLSNAAFSDIFYYGRNNNFGARAFAGYRNGIKQYGAVFQPGMLGFGIMNTESSTTNDTSYLSANTDSVSLFIGDKKVRGAIAYGHSSLKSIVDTTYFGTASGQTTADTFGVEVTYGDRIGNLTYRFGPRYSSTKVKGFTETNVDIPLIVGSQSFNSGTWVTNIDYTKNFYFGDTVFYAGADLEHLYNFYSSDHKVKFSTGGDFIMSKTSSTLDKTVSYVSLNMGAVFKNTVAVGLSTTNINKKNPTYTFTVGAKF